MTQRPDDERFLRAAIKTGLRLQEKENNSSKGSSVATLLRIKASLVSSSRRKNPKLKP